jgi:hypothetical protein
MNRSSDSATVSITAKDTIAAAKKVRSYSDESSSNEKQTRDSPRGQEGARIDII